MSSYKKLASNDTARRRLLFHIGPEHAPRGAQATAASAVRPASRATALTPRAPGLAANNSRV